MAVAYKILGAIYHMLSHQVGYNELGDLSLDQPNKHHLTGNLVRRLERLGFSVTLEQKAACLPNPPAELYFHSTGLLGTWMRNLNQEL